MNVDGLFHYKHISHFTLEETAFQAGGRELVRCSYSKQIDSPLWVGWGGTEKSLRREWLDMLEATVWSGLWGPFLSKSRKLDGKVGTYRVQGGSRILQIKLKKYFPHFCCDDYFGLRLMKPRKKPVI